MSDITNGAETKALQHYPQTVFRFDPLYLRALTPGARDLFEYLSFAAWKEKDLVVRAAAPWAATWAVARSQSPGERRKKNGRRKPAPATRSAERHYGELKKFGLLSLIQRDHDRGNSYLVEPFHLAEFCWEKLPLQNLEKSKLAKYRQNGGTELEQIWAQIDRYRQIGGTFPPKWRDYEDWLRTKYRQNGGQIYFFYSLLLRGLAGHAADAIQRTESKVSYGQNSTPPPPTGEGKEGVGLTADASNKKKSRLEELEKEIEELRTQKEAKPVGGSVKSKVHAHANFDGTSP